MATIKTQTLNLFLDNITGDITPSDLRRFVTNVFDSQENVIRKTTDADSLTYLDYPIQQNDIVIIEEENNLNSRNGIYLATVDMPLFADLDLIANTSVAESLDGGNNNEILATINGELTWIPQNHGYYLKGTKTIQEILNIVPLNIGEVFIASDTNSTAEVPGVKGDGYSWDGSQWYNVGKIAGEDGTDGAPGADGTADGDARFLLQDRVLTVGPGVGNDYMYLVEALDFIQEQPIGIGKSADGWTNKRSVSWIIQLDAGDVEWYEAGTVLDDTIRFEHQYNQVRIKGNADGTTKLVTPNVLSSDMTVMFNHCNDVKFSDILQIDGTIRVLRSNLVFNIEDSAIAELTFYGLLAEYNSTIRVHKHMRSRYLSSTYNSYFYGNNVLLTDTSGQSGVSRIDVSENSLLEVKDVVNVHGNIWSGDDATVILQNLTIDATHANGNIAIISLGSKIIVRNPIINNSSEEIGYPLNTILSDGSYITDTNQSMVFDSHSGTTLLRPVTPQDGFNYFDTDLNKPIWYNGSAWVDATGTIV